MPITPLRVSIATLGCKLNQAESENLKAALALTGYLIVTHGACDVFILNTCTVTHIADRKSRQLLRRAYRDNPEAALVVTGCYAERERESLLRLPGVKLVIGNPDKDRFPEILARNGLGSNAMEKVLPEGRNRALIKIQDGCQHFCTYCVVPLVRRDCFSIPPDTVIRQINALEADGFKEIVLTGTEIGSYNSNRLDLSGLMGLILKKTFIPRIRLSSLQPEEIKPELLSLWQNAVLCRHIHLPLQSGCDATLLRMRRRYTTAEFEDKINLIRRALPGAGITTDIIVGFPGETVAEFSQSCDFIRRMEFSRIHVFPYSPRPSTLAATFPERVPDRVKKERLNSVLDLAAASAKRFQECFIGQNMSVLFEEKQGSHWSGYTDNYIRIFLASDLNLKNQLVPVLLSTQLNDGLLALMPG